MENHCPQLKSQLEEIKSLYSEYCLALEQAKNTKEYEPALSMQTKLIQTILELGIILDPDNYHESFITEIERKNKSNIPLTKVEIIFLYDASDKVSDPRIAEILQTRNPKEDAPIVFDCGPSEIAWDAKEVDETTKAYIGPWSVENFQVIRNYPNITHFYESFPDKKIFMITLETEPGIDSPQKVEQALKDKDIWLSGRCKYIIEKTEFSKDKQSYDLVRFTVEQLGLKQGATTDEIYQRAQELVLELCPAEVGPHLRLQYTGREWFLIAMQQITDRNGDPCVFDLNSDGADLLYPGYLEARLGDRWDARDRFVFRFRPPAPPVA